MYGTALFFLVALVSLPAIAQSEDGYTGRLDAYVYEELRSPLKIDVLILDNSPRYLQLRDRFSARMKENGIEVAADAPLVLILDINTVFENQQTGERHIGELRIGKGGGVTLRGNIWSNTEDSVLGGRKRSSYRPTTQHLQMTANLSRRDDGRSIWQGIIIYELRGGDPDRAAHRFMPILADAIGQPIQNKLVSIPD